MTTISGLPPIRPPGPQDPALTPGKPQTPATPAAPATVAMKLDSAMPGGRPAMARVTIATTAS